MTKEYPIAILTTETKVQILPSTEKTKPAIKKKSVRAVVTTKPHKTPAKPETSKKASKVEKAPKAAVKAAPPKAPKRVAKDPKASARLKGAGVNPPLREDGVKPGRDNMLLS